MFERNGRLVLAWTGVAALAFVSLTIGAGTLHLEELFSGSGGNASALLRESRVPRTLALVLAGSSLAIAGLIMQMIARNRFVEPATAGTAESAALGVLAVMLLAPGISVLARMLVAGGFALAGTFLFLLILRRIPHRSALVVPLVGLMLGGVIDSITTFFAYRYDLLQSISTWMAGDFSGVLAGRYELLWIGFALALAGYLAADRFTAIGIGETFAVNVGINYNRVVAIGLLIVSLITASVVVTVGLIPFVGLIAPNLVAMRMGDNARRSLPWVALTGAALILLCDIAGRVVRYPYEIPVGTVVGVVGGAVFLALLLRRERQVG
ncbi:ABC transporter permease [Altererythrobacter sp. C41]|uniref:ABC transporter permease n=1 Tax=Altererythrobacter sp. C41 TaxID=2806021 RepID=UPI001933AF53|nr:iron chelate uptake ABC transporter family permease subunit [Altererythrobacter sp. C41]MBM0168996.1 iron chelate uptake ABC transporter family permease subunit [Altererythrobacter sp. C41]